MIKRKLFVFLTLGVSLFAGCTLDAATGARGASRFARRAWASRGSRPSGLDGQHAPTTGAAIPVGLSNHSQ